MWNRFFSAVRKGVTSQVVLDRAGMVEDVLLGKMSGNDIEAVRVVAEVTTALCSNNCEGMFDAGFFIFFKVRNEDGVFQIFHKRLGVEERAILNRYPTLLNEPSRLLERLENAIPLELARAAELRAIRQSKDS